VQSQVQHFYNAAHMQSANLQNNIRKHLFQKYIISIQDVVYVNNYITDEYVVC
jgi:hypothetical protein